MYYGASLFTSIIDQAEKGGMVSPAEKGGMVPLKGNLRNLVQRSILGC